MRELSPASTSIYTTRFSFVADAGVFSGITLIKADAGVISGLNLNLYKKIFLLMLVFNWAKAISVHQINEWVKPIPIELYD